MTDYAGAEFDLGVLALDELGRPTAVGFRISSSNASTGNSQVGGAVRGGAGTVWWAAGQ